MGSKFFPYHPNTNNCQDFILQMLKSNGINDVNAFNFVKQDTSMIFKNSLSKVYLIAYLIVTNLFRSFLYFVNLSQFKKMDLIDPESNAEIYLDS